MVASTSNDRGRKEGRTTCVVKHISSSIGHVSNVPALNLQCSNVGGGFAMRANN